MLQRANIKNFISKLKIGHFNINGIVGNLNELKEFIHSHKIDIMLLNATQLSINKLNKVPGDFNAKNTMWDCRRDNASGKALLNLALKYSYKILCPNIYTLYPYSNAARNTIDIEFSKNLKCDISIDVLNRLNSDHLPVLIVLDKLANIDKREIIF